MKTFYVLPILLAALATSASAQKSPYAGRWDLTVTPQTGSAFPQWMEITEKHGETTGPQIAGVRAPELKRPMPKAWTTPAAIFNGKDLTGWEPIGNAQNSKWVARDGES